MIKAVVTDIEGTTSAISFVTKILFPYAQARLCDWVRAHPEDAGGVSAEELRRWSEADRKEPALKIVQGRIWRSGYERGELKGHIYPDAAEHLPRWRAAGLKLFVYSSGSVEAQQLLFGYSEAGDLRHLFDGWFDLGIGSKLEPASYSRIAEQIACPMRQIYFLSDNPDEIAAAEAAGMKARLIDRARGDTFADVRL